MKPDTVIFDMDGLLIDSEPLWNRAASEVFARYGITLSEKDYLTTTGLRTGEFVAWWMNRYGIGEDQFTGAEQAIISSIIEKVKQEGVMMPGVKYILDLFKQHGFRIGVASSSPQELIDLVIDIGGLGDYISGTSSAEFLPYGKPHPQVYLDCASLLGSSPVQCICFEDSFNGMIAAKAARMKCAVVPSAEQMNDARWAAADLKLASLYNFTPLHLSNLQC